MSPGTASSVTGCRERRKQKRGFYFLLLDAFISFLSFISYIAVEIFF